MFEMLKGRKAAIVASTATAMIMGTAAYAAIPDAASCQTNENLLRFNQIGRTGPTGYQGARGPAGPNTVHWAKMSATGAFLGASDPGTVFYGDRYWMVVDFPNVDETKCAVTVTPVYSDGDSAQEPAVGTYENYYGYIYARIVRGVTGGQRHPGNVALDVVANCGMGMTP
jgi:hypothetical protein